MKKAGASVRVREIDEATLDEMARIAGIALQDLDMFKEGVEWCIGFAEYKERSDDVRLQRSDVVPLLDGIIAALEPLVDWPDGDNRRARAAIIARLAFAGVSLESPGSYFWDDPVRNWAMAGRQAVQHIESLIESARRAKQAVELHLPKRGAPAGTRAGLALDMVLDYLFEREEEWGIEWTAYKDRNDGGAAKGSLVQILRLLAPYIVLPRSDSTLLKAIDRAKERHQKEEAAIAAYGAAYEAAPPK
jgi:hypothetical protein